MKPQPNKHVWSDGISWGESSKVPDFDTDAKEMVKTLTGGEDVKKEEEDKDAPIEAEIDPLSQLREGGLVTNAGIIYLYNSWKLKILPNH